MVRKGVVRARARKGILHSDPFKDRARTVHFLIKTFEKRFTKTERNSMAKLAKEILEVGDVDLLFSGKDPYVSGVTIFVYVCRRFVDRYYGVTYNDIRSEAADFATGQSFQNMLKNLKKKFG